MSETCTQRPVLVLDVQKLLRIRPRRTITLKRHHLW